LAVENDADVYHCNEVDSWFIGLLIKFFHGKRCVFDVHEHYPSTFAESRFPNWFQPIVSASVRFVFKILTPFTDRIVLAKKSVGVDFIIDPSKVVIARNFTPLSALNFQNRSAKSQGSEFQIVHLGLFSRKRGWPQILEAMALMRNCNLRLIAIGEINDGSESEFISRVAELSLTDRVVFYKWMPFNEAFEILRTADIGIIAFQPGILNHVYAMPHKMFDYMAAGLAVLLPQFAVEVAPILKECDCGLLIDPSNPSDIASKLDRLIDNPDQIFQMGQRGRNAIQDCYNWDTEARRLVEMYKDMELEL
jgi:glycosyltransferase involved in cell wall biosynthesis